MLIYQKPAERKPGEPLTILPRLYTGDGLLINSAARDDVGRSRRRWADVARHLEHRRRHRARFSAGSFRLLLRHLLPGLGSSTNDPKQPLSSLRVVAEFDSGPLGGALHAEKGIEED